MLERSDTVKRYWVTRKLQVTITKMLVEKNGIRTGRLGRLRGGRRSDASTLNRKDTID